MRRNISGNGYKHVKTVALTSEANNVTVETPLAEYIRVKAVTVADGATLLWRPKLTSGADADALAAADCDILGADGDSGWEDFQPEAIRVAQADGNVTVKVFWISRLPLTDLAE